MDKSGFKIVKGCYQNKESIADVSLGIILWGQFYLEKLQETVFCEVTS